MTSSDLSTADLAAVGLRLALDGPVATITLDRPEVRNAQTPAMWRTLARIGEQLTPEIRVVVIEGAGGTFSAGLDRRLLDPTRPVDGEEGVLDLLGLPDDEAADVIDDYQRGFTFLRDPRFVSVAVLRGHALGAGFQLALACDLRIAADDTVLGMREAALGLVPDLTGTQPLVEIVGYARAMELCVTARDVPAAEALALGLVQQVVPGEQLADAVATLTDRLVAPLSGVAAEIKALLQSAGSVGLDEQRRLEREAQVRRFRALAALMA